MTWAQEVGRILQQRGWLLSTAESCTGGAVAMALTDIAGSSAWFDGGWVTYSNASKIAWLGVDEALIQQQGAVSEAVVQAMAEGALKRSRAHIALAVSGVAGPAGGSPEKPVGTVCLAWAWEGQCDTITHHFSGDRSAVRKVATEHALRGVLARAQYPAVG